MAKKQNKLYIGTAGWVYPHWRKVFYPPSIKNGERLKYFSNIFKTAEINYSFYRLPQSAHYKRWYQETPDDFIFSLKASRFITHLKKLKDIADPWQTFLARAKPLKDKLGPILLQFPANVKLTPASYKKIEDFLKLNKRKGLLSTPSSLSSHFNLAFEFRHESWSDTRIIELFKKYNVALVSADSSNYPQWDIITADFSYLRMHGSEELFSSNYSDKELKTLAKRIKDYQGKDLTVYCYFNNDAQGFAPANAQRLMSLLS